MEDESPAGLQLYPHRLFQVKDQTDPDDWGLRMAVVFMDGRFWLFRKSGKSYVRTKEAGFERAQEVVNWAQKLYTANGQTAFDV